MVSTMATFQAGFDTVLGPSAEESGNGWATESKDKTQIDSEKSEVTHT